MKQIFQFTGVACIAGALTFVPAAATGQSTQSPPAGTQSGQGTTGSSRGTTQQDRDRVKKTGQGEQVGVDVPSQGTDTDQLGRTAAKPGTSTDAGLAAVDRTFLLDAMEGNKAEIELAKLAGERATSASVKELARTIQQHHTEANTKVKSVAGGTGASTNDPDLKPAHKQLRDKLSKLQGAAFDQAYAAEMVKDHQKDIAKYEKASRELKHSGLKAYASETLPHLREHLEKARQASTTRGTQ
jgi:putative membrane protein